MIYDTKNKIRIYKEISIKTCILCDEDILPEQIHCKKCYKNKKRKVMRKIPESLKEDMANDPFYKKCCISGVYTGKLDLHHNLIYAGKKVNEKWCILPLAKKVHDNIQKHKEICDWIMLSRATEHDLRDYSESIDYIALKARLITKYGIYNVKR